MNKTFVIAITQDVIFLHHPKIITLLKFLQSSIIDRFLNQRYILIGITVIVGKRGRSMVSWYLNSPSSLKLQDYTEYSIVHNSIIWGRISTTCVVSMWRNDTKFRYMFMFPLKNLACKGLIKWIDLSLQPPLQSMAPISPILSKWGSKLGLSSFHSESLCLILICWSILAQIWCLIHCRFKIINTSTHQ